MGPVEYVFLAIGVVFAFIGLARGYSRELGNTILIMYTVAALGLIEGRFKDNIQQVGTSILGLSTEQATTFLALSLSLALIVMVVASYTGITFNFGGKEVGGLAGSLISLGVGLLNGYLVAGSLWYYANLAGYPLVPVTQNFTTAAQTILAVPPTGLLPQTIFPSPFYWLIPATVLMFLRVRG